MAATERGAEEESGMMWVSALLAACGVLSRSDSGEQEEDEDEEATEGQRGRDVVPPLAPSRSEGKQGTSTDTKLNPYRPRT